MTRLKELQQAFKGTPVGDKARQRLQKLSADPAAKAALAEAERQSRAADALTAAEKLRADAKHEQAYLRFKTIAKDFACTEAAATAEAVVAEYEKDPAFVKKALEAFAGDKARAALSMADSYARNGRTDAARKRYQQIIADYPGTTWAEEAKRGMEKLAD